MNKSYQKRTLILLLVFSLFLGCCGCKNDEKLDLDGKVTLTLATTESTRLDTDFIAAINAADYPFMIEIVNYQEHDNADDRQALIKLNKEIASGGGPDIIDLAAFEFSLTSYASKGVFEDLYPYLDKDEVLSRGSIVDSVLHAAEYNNTLPGIFSGFTIKTIAANTNIMQNKTTWTVDEFSNYVANIGTAFLLSEEVMDMGTLLYNLSQTTFHSFIDYSACTVDFERREFVDLLKICGASGLANDNEIMARIVSVGGFMEHQILEKTLGENVTYVGFPTLDGSDSGSYLNNLENYLAISSVSTKKELCWEFIRLFLLEDYQDHRYIKEIETAFPSNKSSLKKLASYSMETIYDEEATEVTSRGMYGDTYQPATQNAIDQLLTLIDSVQMIQRYDSVALTELINEEICAYLQGNQSAEKTTEILQNRASTLMSELK